MTSEAETLKTNEFLRRRKLRLQQVREQSKDIAKKIRQRAQGETLRQVVDLDANKQKEYFDRQEKLVKRLEVLYARGLNNIGASHQSASELPQEDVIKTDLSKVRGREAAAELRKKRQEKLDQQKKLLDRKVQARETANVISREKSAAVVNKLAKAVSKNSEEATQKVAGATEIVNAGKADVNHNEIETVIKNDMATQYDADTVPNEWQPAVPALVLPNDDQGSLNQDELVKSDHNKRLDLFAVSKEMPTDLRGQHAHVSDRRDTVRPSLTLVSEYLQTRKLRLRETEPPSSSNKKPEDMSSLRQTILRTRNSKTEVPGKSICADNSKTDHALNKKSSVTMYNHNTRDSRDLPCSDEQLVVRDSQTEEDAYAQALKEVSLTHATDKERPKKVQDMRSKVAVTKQTVEKEYKATMNFLNSLPKDKCSKVTKTAYMDERRQQIHNETRQHRLQQEYRKIEKECRRHHHACTKKGNNKSKPTSKQNMDDDFDSRDFQYSWMPVPESDGSLAIHTIPTTIKEGKSGNTVKFSTVDSYHEYRSRHKHTPPTKETCQDKPHKNRPKTVIIDKNTSQSPDDYSSDTSSVENLRLEKKEKKVRQETKDDQSTSDAERIIIYKILDRKSGRQSKKKNKLLSDIAKSLTSIEKVQKSAIEDNNGEPAKRQHAKEKPVEITSENLVSFEHVNEGIYKIAEDKKDNIASIPSPNEIDSPENTPVTEDKHRNLSHDKKRGSVPEWESGHISQPQRVPKPCHCSTTCRDNHNKSASKVQSNASTSKHLASSSSTSSFETAKNDKSKTEPSESGYIKLVDVAGQETGKFFLGDTGYLKDNAYEVVIQLRKKDSGIDDEKSQGTTLPAQNKESTTESTGSKPKVNTEIVESIHFVTSESDVNTRRDNDADNVALSNTSGKASRSTSPRSSKEPGIIELEVEKKKTAHQNKDQSIACQIEETDYKNTSEPKNNVSDKGTSTSIQNDDQIPMSRYDPPSRPATTTFTQTTSSPIHRPVYIHMSSSTSTAYMSPPDMILPNFLRRDSGMTDYETNELKNIDTARKHGSEGHYKKCRHVRKSASKVNMQHVDCRKNKHNNTPPNSVRSSHTSADNLRLHKASRSKNLKVDKKCKCRNCAVSAKDDMNKWSTRTKSSGLDSYRSSHNFNLLTAMRGATKNKYHTTSSACSRRTREASLAPIVKGYINKLLALNKEGLKALEVAEQECSSVGTPGSSIINVSCNIDGRKSSLGNKISLEYLKKAFMRQIMHEHLNLNNHIKQPIVPPMFSASKKSLPRKARRKSVHKIKSLNISKHLLQKHKNEETKSTNHASISTTTDEYSKTFASSNASNASRTRPRSSHSSKRGQSTRPSCTYNSADTTPRNKETTQSNKKNEEKEITPDIRKQYMPKRTTIPETSPETESTKESHDYYKNKPDVPISMSTQTSQNIDSDFMKLAEDKLHNMEKIADLTEKCTKRLSNLAKVLEEVRKNKSLVYSHISTSDSTDSHSDQKSDKVVKTPVPIDLGDVPNTFEIKSPEPIPDKEHTPIAGREKSPSEFISFLTDIPKPVYKLSEETATSPVPSNVPNLIRPIPISPINTDTYTTEIIKCKQKPPPALSRIHLKHAQEDIVPHELSTVLEVDSPMSIKNKTHSSRRYDPNTSNRSSNEDKEPTKSNNSETSKSKEFVANPDLLQSNLELPKQQKVTNSNDSSKFQMIDLKHFNEIMLEPFISIHEYAKKYNVEAPDEMSNIEEIQREEVINDDMSSLHSDGSLPDVIAELLKRNIITEPFKFDTPSNVNSTTISSESTLSMLALSKARKTKKRGNVMFRNKENVVETSDTLSISSNPDLENAFKKLGMGWASSTLKKTKERLALSSSSNTSSSSISQLKIKSFHHEAPALVTDSVSSVLLAKKGPEPKIVENSKDAKHQTSFLDSMTVNEFLANELANKITFTTNKTGINETEEFVSLFETKMPEGMNQQTQNEENSNDSVPSGVNRARTSTPVQIFKSMTYHSTSGSNLSNGLFSNADDLSSVKMTSNSMKNNSTSDKDELTIPNFSLKMKKGVDSSKSD